MSLEQIVGLRWRKAGACLPRRRFNVALRCFAFSIASLAIALGSSPTAQAAPINILYYGNSFMDGIGSTRPIPDVVSDIAVALGYQAPTFVNASFDGADFSQHLMYNTGVVSSGLPAGQQWDYVVMQNYSTAPTRLGNVAQHRADSVALYQAVAAHSPSVVPVLFETWARGPGHEFYTDFPPIFPGGPSEMQQEVREGYQLAAQDINAAVGSPLAKIAAVGDAWEALDYHNLHAEDNYHAQNRGTFLAALITCATIYGITAVDEADLMGVLGTLDLLPNDGHEIIHVTNLLAVPEPSSALLLVAGGVGLIAWRTRRARKTVSRR